MAKVLVVTSGKGGVGKSTVCVNIASAMQGMGIKTAVFDMDSQGVDLTFTYACSPPKGPINY